MLALFVPRKSAALGRWLPHSTTAADNHCVLVLRRGCLYALNCAPRLTWNTFTCSCHGGVCVVAYSDVGPTYEPGLSKLFTGSLHLLNTRGEGG